MCVLIVFNITMYIYIKYMATNIRKFDSCVAIDVYEYTRCHIMTFLFIVYEQDIKC